MSVDKPLKNMMTIINNIMCIDQNKTLYLDRQRQCDRSSKAHNLFGFYKNLNSTYYIVAMRGGI